MIKLVAIDIDGTLMDDNLEISRLNEKAIKLAIDKGIKIVFCSGRSVLSLLSLIDKFNLKSDDEYVVGYNGAMGTNIISKEVVFEDSLKGKDVKKLAKAAGKLDIDYSIHLYDKVISNRKNYYSDYEAKINGLPLEIKQLSEIDDNINIPKIIILGKESKLNEAIEKMPDFIFSDYNAIKSTKNFLEIVKLGISKYTGTMKIANLIGIKKKEILGIGDELNDLALIKGVGVGVAMENANPLLIQKADFVTKSNNESGVAYALNKYLKLNMNEFD